LYDANSNNTQLMHCYRWCGLCHHKCFQSFTKHV